MGRSIMVWVQRVISGEVVGHFFPVFVEHFFVSLTNWFGEADRAMCRYGGDVSGAAVQSFNRCSVGISIILSR